MARWLTHYNAAGPLPLRRAIDQLLEDSIVESSGVGSMLAGEWPAVDMYETDDEIVVKASMPGVKPEDVQLTITGQTLTIRGETRAEEQTRQEQYVYQERRFGTFSRSLQLPNRVSSEGADASFDEGVLTLRIPKAEEIKPRQIEIKAGNGSRTSSNR